MLGLGDHLVYLYGPTGILFTTNSWLARTPAGQVTNVGAWQFITDAPGNNRWSKNGEFAGAKPTEFSNGPPIAQLSVVPYGNRYLAGAYVGVIRYNNAMTPIPTPIGSGASPTTDAVGLMAPVLRKTPVSH
jgi:hypothetical protein